MLVLIGQLKVNIAKAKPHFIEEGTPAIEVIQSAISIQLFRSAVSPLRGESVTVKMLNIIQGYNCVN
jgi:hypothetical protein